YTRAAGVPPPQYAAQTARSQRLPAHGDNRSHRRRAGAARTGFPPNRKDQVDDAVRRLFDGRRAGIDTRCAPGLAPGVFLHVVAERAHLDRVEPAAAAESHLSWVFPASGGGGRTARLLFRRLHRFPETDRAL